MMHVQKGGEVDNLVLIGSPISANFLKTLQTTNGIRSVHVKALTVYGDPIYAGMGAAELILNTPRLSQQMKNKNGHFYYAPSTEMGMRRRRDLAKDLYNTGLR